MSEQGPAPAPSAAADVARYTVTLGHTLRQVLACINASGKGVALVVDDERRLLGASTDGDVRRALLEGAELDRALELLRGAFPRLITTSPVWAPVGTGPAELLALMRRRDVRQVPLLDAGRRVQGLATFFDLAPQELPLRAVIMAGGRGTRLAALTVDTPKPMLQVGDRPLLEHTLAQLRQAGVRQVNITTHFKGEKIVDHFGDGAGFGVEVKYVAEDRPLGTAGALRLVEEPAGAPLLVMNGDILTQVDFRAMLAFHKEHRATITMGVRRYELQVPFGVVESVGARVERLSEKPVHTFLVNAGIYVLEPRALGFVHAEGRCDMTDVIQAALDAGELVASFPIHEYWLDIGDPEAYQKAQDDTASGLFSR